MELGWEWSRRRADLKGRWELGKPEVSDVLEGLDLEGVWCHSAL